MNGVNERGGPRINPSDTLLHARSNSPIVNDQEFWGGSQNGQIAHSVRVLNGFGSLRPPPTQENYKVRTVAKTVVIEIAA